MAKYYNASLRNLENRLRKFKDDLDEHLEDIIRAHEDLIVEAIAEDQLFEQGIDGDGQSLMSRRPYQPSTIRRKLRKGQPTDRVTLRDTGRFHDSMYLVFDEGGFYITSDDYKTPFLTKKYGPTIFKLTGSNFTRIMRDGIRKELVKRLKAELKK